MSEKTTKISKLGAFLAAVVTFLILVSDSIPSDIRATNSHPPDVNALTMAEKYTAEGNFQAAIDLLEKSLPLIQKRNDPKTEVLLLLRLGLLTWNIGQIEASANYYQRAKDLCLSFHYDEEARKAEVSLEIYALYSKGKSSRIPGKYPQSIEAFNEAIALAKSISSVDHELKCLRHLSLTYWEMNEVDKYKELNVLALSIARKIKHRKEEGICLNNIGLFFWKKCDYSKALRYLQMALEIAKKGNFFENEADALANIGLVLSEFGLFDRALDYIQQATDIDLELKNYYNISVNLDNIGNIYRNKARLTNNKEYFRNAITSFNKSLEIAKESKNIRIETSVLNNLAETYYIQNEYSLAFEFLNEAFKKALSINYSELIGTLYTNYGNNYLIQNRFYDSDRSYRKAISLADQFKDGKILWEAFFGLGQCYEKEKNYEKALEYYEKSAGIIDRIRSQIHLDTFKTGYVRNKTQVYECLINLLLRIRDRNSSLDDKIFDNVEKAKARAFLDSLEESRIDIQESMNRGEREELETISNNITSYSANLGRSSLAPNVRNDLEEKLSKEEDRYMMLISRIREENPALANLIAPRPISLSQVKKNLDERTGLVEYFLGDTMSLMICVTKSYAEIHILPSRSEIERSVKGFIKYLSSPPAGRINEKLAGKRIFEEILHPLKTKAFEKIEDLIIVPDGILFYLPFEVLASESQRQNDPYLLDKYRISYAPSASVLFFLKQMKNSNMTKQKGILAFGDPRYFVTKNSGDSRIPGEDLSSDVYLESGFEFFPIPYSRREIKAAAGYFPRARRSVFLGDQAREDIVKKTSSRSYQIVHFACHGFIDDVTPIRSALVLSQGLESDDDGFLQVRELYNLKFSANLVILSACQTGKGTLEKGEGLLGLPRIFFYSGAASVVTSLWAVNDKSTALFMKKFYEKLSAGFSKTEALRRAKQAMLRSRFDHPYYWAAFVLSGEPDSVIDFR